MAQSRASIRPSVVLLLVLTACGDPAGVGGPAGPVVIVPGQARLAAVGDTTRLRAAVYNDFGVAVSAGSITWSAIDPDVFTIDQGGLVTGLRAQAVGRAVASAGEWADTAYVVVADPDASPCLGYAAPV